MDATYFIVGGVVVTLISNVIVYIVLIRIKKKRDLEEAKEGSGAKNSSNNANLNIRKMSTPYVHSSHSNGLMSPMHNQYSNHSSNHSYNINTNINNSMGGTMNNGRKGSKSYNTIDNNKTMINTSYNPMFNAYPIVSTYANTMDENEDISTMSLTTPSTVVPVPSNIIMNSQYTSPIIDSSPNYFDSSKYDSMKRNGGSTSLLNKSKNTNYDSHKHHHHTSGKKSNLTGNSEKTMVNMSKNSVNTNSSTIVYEIINENGGVGGGSGGGNIQKYNNDYDSGNESDNSSLDYMEEKYNRQNKYKYGLTDMNTKSDKIPFNTMKQSC